LCRNVSNLTSKTAVIHLPPISVPQNKL
jgi:hypothetical protein